MCPADSRFGSDTQSWLDLLEDSDRWLRERSGWASLQPERERASDLVSMSRVALTPDDAPELCHTFARGLAHLVRQQAEHFPHNIFCDLDFLCASLLQQARASDEACADLVRSFGLLEELNAAFGRHSTIRFRYLHDFLYGWDWARWVARDPDSRRLLGPFSTPFLENLLERGQELQQLIARQDARYHRLEAGHFRNPFGFVREPKEECLLHGTLARRGMIPLEAWSAETQPEWNRPYGETRATVARELGLERTR